MDSGPSPGPTQAPRVVALMPTWNGEAFIEPTLESLAAQVYPHLDVLISDDASTDRTPEICRRFSAAQPRWRFTRQQVRRGWTGNATWLLQQADGDYFFFAFHDDPLKSTYVSRLVEALAANPRAVLAFSDIEFGAGTMRYLELERVHDRLERARRLIRKKGAWWIPGHGLFRADAGKRVPVRRHLGGEYSADWPWLLHLALLGEFVRVPEPLLRKDLREEGVSSTWRRTFGQKVGVCLSCMKEIRRAGLPPTEEISLHGEILAHGLSALWPSGHGER